jgi:ATP phosphoribosyltransferase
MPSQRQNHLLTFALSKGKLLPPSLHFFKKCHIDFPSLLEDDRRLIIDLPKQKMRMLLVRPTDVPTYVEQGVADIGIAGSDLLMEQIRDVYELADLRFGACRLVLAEPKEEKKNIRSKLRVATKYTNLTEQYFAERAIPIEMIKLYGSVELAPLVGMADQIVDLSESGATLRANGLNIIDEIVQCSARLIVNRASLKLKYKTLFPWITTFKQEI